MDWFQRFGIEQLPLGWTFLVDAKVLEDLELVVVSQAVVLVDLVVVLALVASFQAVAMDWLVVLASEVHCWFVVA